ncbi:hypothetical protein [Streptomyces pinistramenti]|uniref:hypothetical protein n=1 Tax=Streptomyces pinistramenti TaxID=2884812 RepID=UPI001D07F5A3|nr:hypothetical protein [Streptomyces pinistramenti]MCB5908803.1 hypothetical protein [Streptomyces pinistramenti]
MEQTAKAIAEEMEKNRSRQRAKAVKHAREQVAQGRSIAHKTEAAELERLAVLGQIPPAEYKARMAALVEGTGEENGR